MWTSRISAIVQVRVESLEGVYYRKKELLYIPYCFSNSSCFSHLFQGFDLLVNVYRQLWSMLLVPKRLKDATFDDGVPFRFVMRLDGNLLLYLKPQARHIASLVIT